MSLQKHNILELDTILIAVRNKLMKKLKEDLFDINFDSNYWGWNQKSLSIYSPNINNCHLRLKLSEAFKKLFISILSSIVF